MPIYEYGCSECGNNFEEMLSVAEGKAREGEPCPACGKCSLKRKIGAPAIHMRYSPMHPRHMRGQRKQFGRKKNTQ